MMRITNSQITSLMHNSMNTSSAELGKLMQQMATGKRILLPSDDPIASVRVLRVQREEASLEQFRKNIANVSGSLSTQEANLKSTSDAMLNVRDLLLWAANGSNTSEDLAVLSKRLEDQQRGRDPQLQVVTNKSIELKGHTLQQLDSIISAKGQTAYSSVVLGKVDNKLLTLQITLPAEDQQKAQTAAENIINTIVIQ